MTKDFSGKPSDRAFAQDSQTPKVPADLEPALDFKSATPKPPDATTNPKTPVVTTGSSTGGAGDKVEAPKPVEKPPPSDNG